MSFIKLNEGENPVRINGQFVQVKANVRQIESMSAHADEPKLLSWLKHIQGVQKIILTHGEDPSREALQQSISNKFSISDIQLPQLNQELSL